MRRRSALVSASFALRLATGCGARSGLSLFDESPLSSGGTASGVGGFGGVAARAGFGGTLATAGSGASGNGAAGGAIGAMGGSGGVGGSGSMSTSAGFGGASGAAGSTPSGGAGGALCTPGMPGCSKAFCGDGVVEAPEECDDGNVVSGDGCSASCNWEPRLVAAGAWSACAIGANGVVKCWGLNSIGELGTTYRGDAPGQMGDNLPAVDLGTGRTASAIVVGVASTCAVLDNGTVKCWGWNNYGQLGLGDTVARGEQPGQMGDNLAIVDLGTGRTAQAIAHGGGASNDESTCALLDNGTIKCWGNNGYGQLGLGDTNNRGDQPGEMGDNLPAVDLGTGRTARAIAVNRFTTCALLDNGTVKCWGFN